MFELRKKFLFESAHTLVRDIDAAPSRRIHGHSYTAEVTLRGLADPKTGMLMDLGHLDRLLQEVREKLDHHFLNDVPELGAPTIENLSAWIWRALAPVCPGLSCVTVSRNASGDSCSYHGPTADAAPQSR